MLSFPSVIKSKLPNTGTTIFATMTKLAGDCHAINLSQGFPDFPCSEKLINLVGKYMRQGENQYAPMQGILPLREAISEKVGRIYGIQPDVEQEINITAGATQAIYAAITSVIREGDEVIVFTPAYDCYVPAIELSGGVPIYIQMQPPGYSINWEEVKKFVNQKTKMIIINTPHNPTGTVLTKDDMLELQKITRESDIIILSDEVYEHIIFDKLEHQSVLRFPDLAQRSFVVFSFGKTFHATGWKIGYCIAPANLMAEFRKVHQFEVFTVNRPIQFALAEFLRYEDEYLRLNSFYQEKRDFFVNRLVDSRFTILPSKGTYFQLLGYSDISDARDVDYAIELTKEVGVASIPTSVFYHREVDNKMLRFCFAKEKETLEKAAELLCRI